MSSNEHFPEIAITKISNHPNILVVFISRVWASKSLTILVHQVSVSHMFSVTYLLDILPFLSLCVKIGMVNW